MTLVDVIVRPVISILQKNMFAVPVVTLQQDKNLEAIEEYKILFQGLYEICHYLTFYKKRLQLT